MNLLKTKQAISASVFLFPALLMLLSSTSYADATSKYQWEVFQEQKQAAREGRKPRKIEKETSSQKQWRIKKEQERKRLLFGG
jgi:hypothetical protein